MATKLNKWPMWFDVIQGATGLILVLFMWTHMFMVSSILLGKDSMYWVTKMFEGEPLFGKPYPILVSLFAAFIFALVVIHAFLAMRKFPASHREYRILNRHSLRLKHGDTWLWYGQVITGFILFFTASIHLHQLMVNPSDIGPYASSDRIWSGNMWPLYLILLFAVELHAGIGIYRLAIKWGWGLGTNPKKSRTRLKLIKWGITVFFLILGLLALTAYIKIGIAHADHVGERYRPNYIIESNTRNAL